MLPFRRAGGAFPYAAPERTASGAAGGRHARAPLSRIETARPRPLNGPDAGDVARLTTARWAR